MSLGMAQVIVVWLGLATVAALYGGATFVLLVKRPATEHLAPAPAALATLYRVLATLAVILVPLGFWLRTAVGTHTSLSEALQLIVGIMRDTRVGRLYGVRVALALGLFSAAWMPARTPFKEGALAVLGALWLCARAAQSRAFDDGPLALSVYAVHMLAGALWLGAMVAFAFGVMQVNGRRWAAAALGRLWGVAGWCALVVVASGFLIAYGVSKLTPQDLIYSRYGRTLVAKLALFTVIIVYGVYVRFRLSRTAGTPEYYEVVRAVGFVTVLLIGMMEFAALLSHSAIPH
jgi:putative copper export protein